MSANIIIRPRFSNHEHRLTYQSAQPSTYCTGGRIVTLNPGEHLNMSLTRDELTDLENINIIVDDLLKRRDDAAQEPTP